MPTSLDANRRALQRLANRGAGLVSRQPRYVTGQQIPARVEAEIASLPVDDSEQVPLQILEGEFAGSFHFMLGADRLGEARLFR